MMFIGNIYVAHSYRFTLEVRIQTDSFLSDAGCSHGRSVELFKESVRTQCFLTTYHNCTDQYELPVSITIDSGFMTSPIPSLTQVCLHGRPEGGARRSKCSPWIWSFGQTFGKNTNILCHNTNIWSKY